jgi:hypothetical protein
MTEVRQVQLPADLCAAAEKKFAGRFSSLEELLIFVLKDLSADDASQADRAEQHIIEERLRELGYI